MKRDILFSCFTLLLAAFLIYIFPTDAEGAIYDDTVRLHILANSDTEEDQDLKLSLRDALLKNYGERLSAFASIEEATEELSKNIPEIERFCNEEISRLGYSYSAKTYIGEEWYETRDYDSFSLPAGRYTSLRIIIGEGEGQNWWCVMYPPLCLDAAICDTQYTDAEDVLITKNYRVKFKMLEIISKTFG